MKVKSKTIQMAIIASACFLSGSLTQAQAGQTRMVEFQKLPQYLKDEAGGKKVDKVEIFETEPGRHRYKFAAFYLKKKNHVDSRVVVFELLQNKDALPNLIWSTKWQPIPRVSFVELKDSTYKNRPVVLVVKTDSKGKAEGDLFGFEGAEMKSLKEFKGKSIKLVDGENASTGEIMVTDAGKKSTYRWSQTDQTVKKIR